MDCPSRRHFLRGGLALAGVGLAAGCGSLPFQSQQPTRVPRVGFLFTGSSGPSPNVEAFKQGLRELGYVEGQNVVVEWRYAEGSGDRLRDLAAELAQLPLDVIVTHAAGVDAAKQASGTIPIVSAVAGDLVGVGHAASLARPGGNVTGLTNLAPQLAGKRLELAKETLPGLSRVALLWNPQERAMVLEFGEAKVAAQALGVQLQSLEVRDASDFEGAFEVATGGRVEVLMVVQTVFFIRNRTPIVELAEKSRLPTVSGDPDFARAGGLIAYGPNIAGMFRQAATFVDKILKGAKPGELPIEQPTKFDLVVNLRTAQALTLTIPQSVLVQATEVIQ